MPRLALALALALAPLPLAACTDPAGSEPATLTDVAQALDAPGVTLVDVHRERVVGDVYHHAYTLQLGDTANARIRLHHIVRERAPWLPRATRAGAMLLHGDFASFASNFAPVLDDPQAATSGMAVWLAQQGIDVWGVDRRWALTPTAGDLSDFGAMTFAQEREDTRLALIAARAIRAVTGAGADRLHLVGFSRGGFLAYAVAADDAARPPAQRQIKGLVPLDVWAELPPEDTAARAYLCEGAAFERQLVADGVTDSENSFFIGVGELAQQAPAAPSPFFPDATNRDALLITAAQTYLFFPPTPHYHLAAATLEGGVPTAFRESAEPVIAQWFAHATPHQSMAEAADTDGIWCGDGQGPAAPDLARIRVPLLYLGAAGGYGDHGVYSTTRVSSADVTTRVIRRFDAAGAFEDFGHGDLLFARDARDLAWRPLAQWLAAH